MTRREFLASLAALPLMGEERVIRVGYLAPYVEERLPRFMLSSVIARVPPDASPDEIAARVLAAITDRYSGPRRSGQNCPGVFERKTWNAALRVRRRLRPCSLRSDENNYEGDRNAHKSRCNVPLQVSISQGLRHDWCTFGEPQTQHSLPWAGVVFHDS